MSNNIELKKVDLYEISCSNCGYTKIASVSSTGYSFIYPVEAVVKKQGISYDIDSPSLSEDKKTILLEPGTITSDLSNYAARVTLDGVARLQFIRIVSNTDKEIVLDKPIKLRGRDRSMCTKFKIFIKTKEVQYDCNSSLYTCPSCFEEYEVKLSNGKGEAATIQQSPKAVKIPNKKVLPAPNRK